MRAMGYSRGTGKINNSRVLPCQVCNSRVALLKLCMQELKENEVKVIAMVLLEGLKSLHGVHHVWPTAGWAIVLMGALALKAEGSFWSQTF